MLCGISPIYIDKTIMYNGNKNTKIVTERLSKLNGYSNGTGNKSKPGSNSAYSNKSFEEVLKEKITKGNGR